MRPFVRQFWPYLLIAAILHGALVAFLVVNLDRGVLVLDEPAPEAIEATVVDERLVEQELERLRAAEERRLQEIEEGRRAAERAAQQRAAEERRVQELQAQRQREAREAEQQRERERQQAAERQRQEQARIEQLARERAEAERQAAEAQRRREAEAERARQEEEARRRAAAERAAAEERERREIAQRDAWRAEYGAAIRSAVQRSWIQPENWPAGASCTVRVAQIPGGEVVEARVVQSCGSPALDNSVERAVLRASPLPRPPDPSVFSREIEFTFRPEN